MVVYKIFYVCFSLSSRLCRAARANSAINIVVAAMRTYLFVSVDIRVVVRIRYIPLLHATYFAHNDDNVDDDGLLMTMAYTYILYISGFVFVYGLCANIFFHFQRNANMNCMRTYFHTNVYALVLWLQISHIFSSNMHRICNDAWTHRFVIVLGSIAREMKRSLCA